MTKKQNSDSDLVSVLKNDGVSKSELVKYENWVILDGEWEWWIEGIGTQRVKQHDIIVVPKNTWHHIRCVGDGPGVRYAITRPDVNHVYEDE